MHETAPVERDRVPHRTRWWIKGDEYLARARLNLRLDDELAEFGGHIGYDIRPSTRGRGHATALLRAVLRVAGEAGVENALLTCAPGGHQRGRTAPLLVPHPAKYAPGVTPTARRKAATNALAEL
ncbi:hypothetical protein GTY80_11000 [Amycolatopsis sp. SID8362]|nr:hypothetical protein [Amycolatopsis sp. SID8362]NED40466.1 hypothetical protein [Amycolatopsis sp. SID8362]